MPTAKDYQTLDETQRRDLRERERLAQRKAAGGVAPPSAAPAAKPYAPPLTVQEITQKFMGGPAVVPTGIPQRSASTAVQRYSPDGTMEGATGAIDRGVQRHNPDGSMAGVEGRVALASSPPQYRQISYQEARRANNTRMNLQDEMMRASRPGGGQAPASAFDRAALNEQIDHARNVAGAREMQLAGRPTNLPDQQTYLRQQEAARARLQEQADRIARERAGQPLPGDTDTWTYEAGQRALPPELRGQKFTHPQDQANYREFSRWAGQAPSIDPATGAMTRPVDQEHAHVQNLREKEMLARRNMGKPIDFAPINYDESVRNRTASQEFYDTALAEKMRSIPQHEERVALSKAAATDPLREKAAISERERAAAARDKAKAESDTRLIPSQEAATEADNRAKTTDANYRVVGAGAKSAADIARENSERARAEAAAKNAPRLGELDIRGKEATIGLTEAETGVRRKQLENYGKPGGSLDNQERARVATEQATTDAAVRSAASTKFGGSDQIVSDAAKFMPNVVRRMSTPFDVFGLHTGKADMNITGPGIADDIRDLDILDSGVVRNLEGYAQMDPVGGARAANEIIYKMPTPGAGGLYSTKLGAPASHLRYVEKLNNILKRLQALARSGG